MGSSKISFEKLFFLSINYHRAFEQMKSREMRAPTQTAPAHDGGGRTATLETHPRAQQWRGHRKQAPKFPKAGF